MAEAAEATGGSMAAIIGSDNETIAKVCEEVNGFCAPANYNSPQQTVIAGESAAIDEAVAKFAEMGKRAVKLAVSAAFHTKLMAGAAEKFKGEDRRVPVQGSQLRFLLQPLRQEAGRLLRHALLPRGAHLLPG